MSSKTIILNVNKKGIEIYLHHKRSKEGAYMRYFLKHCQIPWMGTEYQMYQNQNIWRLYSLYDYRMEADGSLVPNIKYEIVNPGEWECAIKIRGTNDFHGGLHGFEHFREIVASCDGSVLSLSEEGRYQAEEFEFYQLSDLILQKTADTKIAAHTKHYIFNRDGVTIEQMLTWRDSFTVDYAYLGMLPIRRHGDDGAQITDTARVCGKLYDVSCEGHNFPNLSKGELLRDVTSAEIWGERSGIYARLEVVDGLKPGNFFFIQNTNAYNKLYFSFLGDGGKHTTEKGEVWYAKTHFNIYRFKD